MLTNPNNDYFYVIPAVNSRAVLTPTTHPAYISPTKTHSVKKDWYNCVNDFSFYGFERKQRLINKMIKPMIIGITI
jgi:hypothetical protein